MNSMIERIRPIFAPDDGGGSAGGSPAPSGNGVATPASPSSGASPSAAPSSSPSSDTGAPAPSATPTTPGAASSREPPKMMAPDGGDIFSGFDSDDDEPFDPTTEAAPVVDGMQPQPQQPPPQTAAPAPVEGQQPTPQPAAAPTGQQGQQPQAAASPLPTHAEPGKIADTLYQNRAALIDHLAATQFSLSQAEAEALETDAVGAIPKIMARVFVEAQVAAMRQMQNVIPAMTSQMAALAKRNDANQAKFYTRWPSISAEQHGELVNRLARTYRQMNPQHNLDQMIEELGPIVMMTAKIQPGVVGNGAASIAPRVPPGTPPRRPPAPFQPAGAGVGGPSPAAQADPWSGLGGDYGNDD